MFTHVAPRGQFESETHSTHAWVVVSHTAPFDEADPASVPVPASAPESGVVAPSAAAPSSAASVAPCVPPAPSDAPSAPAASTPASGVTTGSGQSELLLQPGAQAVPAQYSLTGQLSFEGKHSTHLFVVVSHQGSAPWHCEFTTHCTHAPERQTCPVGHGCVVVHPATHASVWHTTPAGQSPSARQGTQVLVVVSHFGFGEEQSLSARQPTHAFTVVSHT